MAAAMLFELQWEKESFKKYIFHLEIKLYEKMWEYTVCPTLKGLFTYIRSDSRNSVKSSPQRLHSTLIKKGYQHTEDYKLILYDTSTPTHRRKHAIMCILAQSVHSLVEQKKKNPRDTQSWALVRGVLFIGLLQWERQLFPHVWDQHFTRVKGRGERGRLSINTTLWHKNV